MNFSTHLVRGGFNIPMTAHDEFGAQERCQSAGAKAYLLKPIQEDALIAAIKTAIVSREQD
ncbi:hypothetical protein [Bradyrhizobium sp. RT3a]|uniref:hypothetical protein n=1 Tax=Bradyrhizobium sp. RT3a TaxID=3156333 RepID=UPI00339AFA5D